MMRAFRAGGIPLISDPDGARRNRKNLDKGRELRSLPALEEPLNETEVFGKPGAAAVIRGTWQHQEQWWAVKFVGEQAVMADQIAPENSFVVLMERGLQELEKSHLRYFGTVLPNYEMPSKVDLTIRLEELKSDPLLIFHQIARFVPIDPFLAAQTIS